MQVPNVSPHVNLSHKPFFAVSNNCVAISTAMLTCSSNNSMHVIYSAFQINMDRKKASDLSEQGGVDEEESVVTTPVHVDEGVGVNTTHGAGLSRGDGGDSAAEEATVHVHTSSSKLTRKFILRSQLLTS